MLAFNIINEYIFFKKSLEKVSLKNFPEFNKNIFKEFPFIVPRNRRTKTSNIKKIMIYFRFYLTIMVVRKRILETTKDDNFNIVVVLRKNIFLKEILPVSIFLTMFFLK